jgi:hypothetical protein
MSVDDFFAGGVVRFRHTDGNYWVRTEPTFPSGDTSLPLLKGVDPNDDRWPPPCYCCIIDQNGGNYYYFRPYSMGKNVCVGLVILGICFGQRRVIGAHVGDWERMTVEVDAANNTPVRLHYAAHGDELSFAWSDQRIQRSASTGRYEAFAALGSHGYWPSAGSVVYGHLPTGEDLKDDMDAGHVLDARKRLVVYDARNRGSDDAALWPPWMSEAYTDAGSGDPADPVGKSIFRWGNLAQDCLPEFVDECELNPGPATSTSLWNVFLWSNAS